MSKNKSVIWMTTVGIIGVLFGIFYALLGLEGFPAYRVLVPSDSFLPWSHGLYGSVFIGFCVILLYGIASWLSLEALFSLVYGVYFNIGVDIALMAVLGYPLFRGIKAHSEIRS